jgi:integrase
MFAIAAMTGLRAGEILGLQAEDFDLEGRPAPDSPNGVARQAPDAEERQQRSDSANS